MIRLTRRALSALTALVMIGTLFVGAPGPVRATADDIYIGFNAHTSGGSCTDPDFTADGADDSAQIALAVADTNASGTLHFCPGIYDIDTTIDLSSTDITLQGANAATTTLDGGGTTQILTSSGAITVSDLTFHDGSFAGFGGAIYATTTVTATDSTFTNNDADDGGAIFGATVTVTASTFTNNDVIEWGGAIYATTLTVTASTFTGNDAEFGGAIFATATSTVTDSTFTNNTADVDGPDSGDGGAIRGAIATVTDSTFTGNISDGDGGAVYATTVTATDSTFTNNDADYGGAMKMSDHGSVVTSRFVGNRAFGSDGGAIEVSGNLDTVRSYFANNSALDEGSLDTDLDADTGGGALWVGGEWTDSRSTFVGNWAGHEGGAVFAQESCVAGRNCYGHSRIVGTVFRNNFARQGGGAIATDFGDLSITGARFIGNSTLGWGGALLLNGDNMTSDYEGCAYSTDNNCSLTVTRTRFSRNRAPARQASVMVMANVANSRVVFKGCRFGSVRRDSIISTFARVRGARHIVEGEYLNP